MIFLNQNICCGYSEESSQCDGSFKNPKHVLKLMGKKILKVDTSWVVALIHKIKAE